MAYNAASPRGGNDGRSLMWVQMKQVRPTCCHNCRKQDNADLLWMDTLQWFLCGDCRKRYHKAKEENRFLAFEQRQALLDIGRQMRYHTNT